MAKGTWHAKARKELVFKYEQMGYKTEFSHGDKRIQLSRGPVSRVTFLSGVNIVLLKDDVVAEIMEIQDHGLTPRDVIGMIKATDLCDQCKIEGRVYPLSNVELTIALKRPKPPSKKVEQMQLIKDSLKLDGCLKNFKFEWIY